MTSIRKKILSLKKKKSNLNQQMKLNQNTLPSSFKIKNGNLFCESVEIDKLASEFGTPLFIYSERAICEAFLNIKKAVNNWPVEICYAVKANPTLGIINLLGKLDSGFDVVSGGELLRVLKAVKNPKKIVFSGVGKSENEMELAIKSNIYCINVESISELITLNKISKKNNFCAPISIRINPDIDPKTHPYISTGLKDNKFGLSLSQAREAYKIASKLSNLRIIGIDCHIGSQITDISPYLESTQKLLRFVDSVSEIDKTNFHIDLGGGLGICYQDEKLPAVNEFFGSILNSINDWSRKNSRKFPNIIFELGRSIIGPAGLLVCKVLALKNGAEVTDKNFIVVDAAMNDLMRPSLYNAYHEIFPISDFENTDSDISWDIVGPICETGDWLGKNRQIHTKEGARLAIASAGAYGSSMASNYNSRTRPAEILITTSGSIQLIKKRESFDDLIRNEI
jgi:diaminopimelate decarboxylase